MPADTSTAASLPTGRLARRGAARRINPELLRGGARGAERLAFAALGWAAFEWARVPPAPLLNPLCAFAGTAVLVLFLLLTPLRPGGLQRFLEEPLASRLKQTAAAVLLPLLASLALTLVVLPADSSGYRAALLHWQVIWALCALSVLSLGRVALGVVIRRCRLQGRFVSRIAIVGYGMLAARLIGWFETHSPGLYELIGIYDDRSPGRLLAAGLDEPPSGSVDDLIARARGCRIDRVIVALPHAADQRVLAILRKLKQIPVDIGLAPDMAGFAAAPGRQGEFAGLPLVNVYAPPLQASQRALKGCFDRLAAALALAILSPVFLVIAAGIRLDSKGPVFFRQRRHGFGGRIIDVCKFRTMDAGRADFDGRQQAQRNDRRVTRVGRLLRRTSLDELPQLFNVLRGEMSLVGPRPLPLQMQVEEQLNHEIVSDYALRHRVKPGITGWAQVNGYRGAVTSAEALRTRVAYDLNYIENWSLGFDLRIMLMTAWALIGGENAF